MCGCANSDGWADPHQAVDIGSLVAVLVEGQRREAVVVDEGFDVAGQVFAADEIDGWKIRLQEPEA